MADQSARAEAGRHAEKLAEDVRVLLRMAAEDGRGFALRYEENAREECHPTGQLRSKVRTGGGRLIIEFQNDNGTWG